MLFLHLKSEDAFELWVTSTDSADKQGTEALLNLFRWCFLISRLIYITYFVEFQDYYSANCIFHFLLLLSLLLAAAPQLGLAF